MKESGFGDFKEEKLMETGKSAKLLKDFKFLKYY